MTIMTMNFRLVYRVSSPAGISPFTGSWIISFAGALGPPAPTLHALTTSDSFATSGTRVHTGRREFNELYPLVRSFLEQDILDLSIDGQRIRGYRAPDTRSIWIRDHSDMMRAFRYFERDMVSAVQHFAQTQAERCPRNITETGQFLVRAIRKSLGMISHGVRTPWTTKSVVATEATEALGCTLPSSRTLEWKSW
jgi:hypothetical protein